jgi:proton-translocating NADH-quinone oxidoreductase, chain N
MNYLELFQNDLKLIIPELFLSTGIIILLVAGVLFNRENTALISNISWLSILTLIISLLLMLNHPFETEIVLNGMLLINNFTLIISSIILFSSIIVLLMSFDYYKDEKITAYEYSILIMLAALGLILLISSYDFLALYLAIELQSLTLYVLATFKRNSEFSTEAGLKYFILGALSSGILLFGISLIYGLTGSTNYETINHLLIGVSLENNENLIGLSIGILFIAVALLFKLAAAPFHMWAPDVYEGSPTIVTAFFAIVPKIGILSVFITIFLETFYGLINQWQHIVIFCAITSMIIGAIGAVTQKKFKRLLAYSAIGHIGYILIGIASATPEGVQGLLLYIIVYIIMSINIFSLYLSLYDKNTSIKIKNISELSGLSKENGILAITLAIAVLSMAGIPPLAGFASKFYIFLAAIESSMYVLAVIGVLTSVIAAVYYIRLIKIMYFENTSNNVSYKTIDLNKSIILATTLFFILFFMVNPSYLLILTHELALNLSL